MELFAGWIGILIHHSAVNDNVVLSDFEAVRRFHMSWRLGGDIITEEKAKELIAAGRKDVIAPWRDIGYHRVTELVKGRPVTREGRPLWMRGAHEPKVNKNYIGYCFIGDFDHHRPSDWTYHEGAREIAKLMAICPNITIDRIEPHNKYSTKTCPGLLFNMNTLIDRVRFYLRRS